MTEEEKLRRRFTRMIAKTATAATFRPAGWWDGDKADERQVRDDLAAGRVSLNQAYEDARSGLAALDAGDLEAARQHAWSATDHYVTSLELRLQRLRPAVREKLLRPAGRRGAPRGPRKKNSTK